MKNPLKDMSRPKALGLAGVAAGVLAISGGAAALNVGLLTGSASEPFSPQPVSVTEGQPSTTTTAASEPVIVYEDVYETVPAPTTVPAVAPAPAPAPAPTVGSSDDDSDDDGSYDDSDDRDEYEDDDSDDHEDEDHEDEDHEVEDHEDEDD